MEHEVRTSPAHATPSAVVQQQTACAVERRRALASLSDDDLLSGLTGILSRSRRIEADLVSHIAEVDERRLFAREARDRSPRGRAGTDPEDTGAARSVRLTLADRPSDSFRNGYFGNPDRRERPGTAHLEFPIAPRETPVPASPAATPSAPPPQLEPLSPGRCKVQFTAGAALRDKVQRRPVARASTRSAARRRLEVAPNRRIRAGATASDPSSA
jgi:hypothetical protein